MSILEQSELGLCPEQHSQDRLDALGGALGFWPLAGDEVEIDVGLDHTHDDVSQLVQVDGEIESRGIGLFFEHALQRIDKATLERIEQYRASDRDRIQKQLVRARFVQKLTRCKTNK